MHKSMKPAGVLVFASLLAFGLPGCGSQYDDKVVGTWDWKIQNVSLVVTINKDGTGSFSGQGGKRNFTWRIQRGNNFVFRENGKDAGFLINSADANTVRGSDPQAPQIPIVWTRKK